MSSSFTTSVPSFFLSFPRVLSLRHPVSPLCLRVVGDTGAAGENPSYLQQQLLWPLWVSIEWGLKLKKIFILFLKQFEICSSKCPWAQSDFLICLFCTKPKEFSFAVVNEKEKSNKPSHSRGWTQNMFDIFVQKLLERVIDYQTRWQFIFFKSTPNHSVLYTIFMVVGFNHLSSWHLSFLSTQARVSQMW